MKKSNNLAYTLTISCKPNNTLGLVANTATYDNLTLFDGSIVSPSLSYTWTGPAGAIAAADKNNAQISINKVGEYVVNISNGFQQCSQKISISGTPCVALAPGNFCLGVTMPAGTTNQTPLPNLAVGDIITAGNFEFTVTQVGNGGAPIPSAGGAGFSGKATMNIVSGPANLKAGLKTEFAGISINECYQVTAVPAQNNTTYFRSEYDPSWGNIVDLSSKTPKPAEAGEELSMPENG